MTREDRVTDSFQWVAGADAQYRQELIDALTGQIVDVTDQRGTTRRGRFLGGREQGFTIELEAPVAEFSRWLYPWGDARRIQEVRP